MPPSSGRQQMQPRHRLVDLPRHQHRVDVQLTEVVDDHADPRPRGAEDVVEQRRFARAEVTGQADDGDGRRQGS
jgi:hypothetical protein